MNDSQRERKRERDRRYRELNREKIRERDRRYRELNREKIRERDRRYIELNREKYNEKQRGHNRKWYQLNKEKISEYYSSKVGKATKKDIKRGKATLINLLGCNNSLEFAEFLKNKLVNKIKKYGKKSCDLIESLEYIVQRKV